MVISDDNGGERQEYIISYGDQLLITIIGQEKELTAPVIVGPDGMISYDIIGNIKAEGFTIAQLSSAIRERLFKSGYYSDPKVSVQLRESHQDIYVIGDVMDPGTKKFMKPSSVIEALAAAGGYKGSADLTNATIIRKKEIIPVNLSLLKTLPQNRESTIAELSKDEYLLKNGDILLIPSAIKEKQISVIGHVHKPGVYTVNCDISLIEAIALASGALEDTADLKHVAIVTNEGVKTLDATMAWNQDSFQNSDVRLIQPGDSVIVPERGKISILGFVVKQGQITVDGEITIIEALALAGIREGADLKKIRIIRSTGQEITVNVSKLWKQPSQYLSERLGAGDTIIVPAKPFSINWNAIYSTVMVFSTLYAVFKK